MLIWSSPFFVWIFLFIRNSRYVWPSNEKGSFKRKRVYFKSALMPNKTMLLLCCIELFVYPHVITDYCLQFMAIYTAPASMCLLSTCRHLYLCMWDCYCMTTNRQYRPHNYLSNDTGPNQTWEIGRVSMKTRRYVGNLEEKNHYGIWKTAEFNMFR